MCACKGIADLKVGGGEETATLKAGGQASFTETKGMSDAVRQPRSVLAASGSFQVSKR